MMVMSDRQQRSMAAFFSLLFATIFINAASLLLHAHCAIL